MSKIIAEISAVLARRYPASDLATHLDTAADILSILNKAPAQPMVKTPLGAMVEVKIGDETILMDAIAARNAGLAT